MKYKYLTFLVMSVFLMSSVLALNPAAYNGLNKGKSDVTHLYLYEKDSSWNIVNFGAWGKLTFKDKFVFNGHGLEYGYDYTLIRYTDPWAGYPVACLGTDVADGYGNVHIRGDWKDGGSKVWLVLSSDVNCETQVMTGWHPTEYLFEYNLI